MGRSTKGNNNGRTPPTSWKGKAKIRCCYCDERAKDYLEGKPLCRVHSPQREGYKPTVTQQIKSSLEDVKEGRIRKI